MSTPIEEQERELEPISEIPDIRGQGVIFSIGYEQPPAAHAESAISTTLPHPYIVPASMMEGTAPAEGEALLKNPTDSAGGQHQNAATDTEQVPTATTATDNSTMVVAATVSTRRRVERESEEVEGVNRRRTREASRRRGRENDARDVREDELVFSDPEELMSSSSSVEVVLVDDTVPLSVEIAVAPAAQSHSPPPLTPLPSTTNNNNTPPIYSTAVGGEANNDSGVVRGIVLSCYQPPPPPTTASTAAACRRTSPSQQ